jgi:hypothetical protein
MGLRQRRSIVDTITRHGNDMAIGLKLLDHHYAIELFDPPV